VACVISAFAPIWLITGLGWAAMRFSALGRATQLGLRSFAFMIAMPAALFSTLHDVALESSSLRPLLAFALSTFGVGLLAFVACRWLLRERLADRVFASMAAAYVNAGNLGIPIALYVLDDVTLVAAVLAFQTMMVTPLILGLVDSDLRAGQSRLKRLLTLPLRTPVIAASALGFTFAAAGWTVPSEVLRPLEILGGAAVPAALFALGMSLHRTDEHELRLTRPELGLAVLLKVVIQPLVAYLAGRFLLGLNGHLLFAVTLLAGLPTAQNTFVYASEYGRPTDLSRDAILVSSVLSVASMSLIVLLLGS
jgi:malonate transporter